MLDLRLDVVLFVLKIVEFSVLVILRLIELLFDRLHVLKVLAIRFYNSGCRLFLLSLHGLIIF